MIEEVSKYGALALAIPVFVAYLVGKSSTSCEQCLSVELGVLGAVTHAYARNMSGPHSGLSEYGPLAAALFVAFTGPLWAGPVSSVATAAAVVALFCVEKVRDGGAEVNLTAAGAAWGAAYFLHAESALLLLPALAYAAGLDGLKAVKAGGKVVASRFLVGAAPVVLASGGASLAACDGVGALVAALAVPSAASTAAAVGDVVAHFGGPVGSAISLAGFAVGLKLLSPGKKGLSREAKVLALAALVPVAFALVAAPAPGRFVLSGLIVGVANAVVATEGLKRAAAKSDVALVVVLALVLTAPLLTAHSTLGGVAAPKAAARPAFTAPARPVPPRPPAAPQAPRAQSATFKAPPADGGAPKVHRTTIKVGDPSNGATSGEPVKIKIPAPASP